MWFFLEEPKTTVDEYASMRLVNCDFYMGECRGMLLAISVMCLVQAFWV